MPPYAILSSYVRHLAKWDHSKCSRHPVQRELRHGPIRTASHRAVQSLSSASAQFERDVATIEFWFRLQ